MGRQAGTMFSVKMTSWDRCSRAMSLSNLKKEVVDIRGLKVVKVVGGRGVGGVPIPTRGHTLWCSISTLCVYLSI